MQIIIHAYLALIPFELLCIGNAVSSCCFATGICKIVLYTLCTCSWCFFPMYDKLTALPQLLMAWQVMG